MVAHRSAPEDGVDVEEAAWSFTTPRVLIEFYEKKLTLLSGNRRKRNAG